MHNLNDLDLLHFKYMVIGTGVVKKDAVKNIDNYKKIFDLMTNECGEEVSKGLVNEALYNLKCYNLIHKSGTCPTIYETDGYKSSLNDDSIFLALLFENLNTKDSFDVLQRYFNITEDKYRNLELDLTSVELYKSLPEVLKYLTDKNQAFSDIITNFLDNGSWKIDRGIPKTKCKVDPGILENLQNIKVDPGIPKTKYKGICLVISNKKVEGREDREGTEADERNIDETFTAEGFSVRIFQNVTLADMNKVVKEIKSEIRESDKAIAVFVMSHGEEGVIITSDGKKFHLEILYKMFYNPKCLKLIRKPKLFFIVSCQGVNRNLASQSDNIQTDSVIETDSVEKLFPKVSELFYGYATYPDFEAYRCPITGTFYVKSLCKAIKSSKTGSIHDIHDEVNEDVSSTFINGYGFQTPRYITMLGPSNKFIFDPKID